MHADSAVLNDLSGRVIGCAFTALNTPGARFLEKVYENALAIEMREAGLAIVQQPGVRVLYRDMVVGEYFPDLLVEDVLLVEPRTVKAFDDSHRMQCTNSSQSDRSTALLLLNFGKSRLEIKRVANGL